MDCLFVLYEKTVAMKRSYSCKMKWLILIIVGSAVVFYLRFLWAMHDELRNFLKPRGRRSWQAARRRNLFRIDIGDLCSEKIDPKSPNVEEHF
jgi:hypothetical protein